MNLIRALVLRDMKSGINSVVNGHADEYKIDFLYPVDVVEYIKEKYGASYEMDSNGWEPDFWFDFNINGKQYQLQASGYRGDLKFLVFED